MEVLISNEQEAVELDLETIKSVALDLMRFEGFDENSQLSMVFCDDEAIKGLNNEYRKKNEATDVLSFPIEMENFIPEIRMVGDIVISTETAIRQAKDYNHSPLVEMLILLIHGLLHLHGYDHIEDEDRLKMRAREAEIYRYVCGLKQYKDFSNAFSEPLIERATEKE